MTPRTDKIYDKVFKRCLSFSGRLVIALINSRFNTNYPPDSPLTYNLTESIDSQLNRTLADTIITVNKTHSYHMEAQMYEDDNIILRMFDYGYHHAVRNTTAIEGCIYFPEPSIIYLADGIPLPNTYTLEINFGKQGSFYYHVPVCNFISMTPAEIEQENMIILLPFYLLKLRNKMKKDRSPNTLNELKNLIFNDILNMINRQLSIGVLSINEAMVLRELLMKLYDHLYADYKECEEGGINAMVDDELILQVDILTDEITRRVTKEVTATVTAEMSKRYEKELDSQRKIIQAYKLLRQQIPVSQIAAQTGLTEDEIDQL